MAKLQGTTQPPCHQHLKTALRTIITKTSAHLFGDSRRWFVELRRSRGGGEGLDRRGRRGRYKAAVGRRDHSTPLRGHLHI